MRYVKGLFLIFLLGSAGMAQADVPQTFNIQGRAMNSNGVAITNGSVSATVVIYDAATGGNILWKDVINLNVNNGYFSAALGRPANPFGTGNTWGTPMDFNEQYYVGITMSGLGDNTEMTPRLALGNVPYSMQVQNGSITNNKLVAGAVGTTTLADGAVTAVKIGSLPTITGSMISTAVGQQISNANIAAGTITGSNISTTSGQQISSSNIGASQIANGNIASGAVDQTKAPFAPSVTDASAGSLTNPKIFTGQITGTAQIVTLTGITNIVSVQLTPKSTLGIAIPIIESSGNQFMADTWIYNTTVGWMIFPVVCYYIAIGY